MYNIKTLKKNLPVLKTTFPSYSDLRDRDNLITTAVSKIFEFSKVLSSFNFMKLTRVGLLSFLFFVFGAFGAFAATITSTTTGGNWSSGSSWVGGSAPGSSDVVIIATTGANKITIDATYSCASLTVNSGATLVFGSKTLTVSGSVINNGSITLSSGKLVQSGTGDFTTSGSLVFSGSGTLSLTGDFTTSGTVTLSSAKINFVGSRNASNTSSGFSTTGLVSLTRTKGSVTFSGNVSCAGIYVNGSGGTLNLGSGLTHTSSGAITLTKGTLNGGSSTLNVTYASNSRGSWTGTGSLFTAGTSKVVFNSGSTQTLSVASTFYNLSFAGSGTKTLTGVPTITNILFIEGAGTLSAAPTYGSSASLQYNVSSSRTTGPEWVSPFAATGGVTIANTGAITMGASKTFNTSIPLTINSGATLTTGSNGLSLSGDFINNGGTFTAGTGTITITGAVDQSIGSFNTSGLVSLTKTGGKATFTANETGGALTINGTGGSSLNLGSGLSHTFSGVLTMTAGVLNGGSSTLNLTAANTVVSGNGATFSAGTGTVNYSGVAQTIGTLTYNNLTLSGTGSKTFPTGTTTVNGTLSIENGSNTNTFTGTLSYGSSASLQYNAGASNRTVSTEWPATFSGSGDILIKGTGIITLNGAKQIGNNSFVDLNISAGAKLATNNYDVTFHSSLVNAGTFTAGSSNIIFAGTASPQTIAGFTTTGNVTLSKTSGTVTLAGNVSAAALTISGSGGTLNLGVSLSHTFTGNVTLTNGVLDGGSSTLTLSGASSTWNGTGSIFTANRSTIVFSGGAQTLSASATTFYNLTFTAGSSVTKTISNVLTVKNNLVINNSGTNVKLSLPAGTTSTTKLLYLGGTLQAGSSYGSTSSSASTKTDTYFAATTGIIASSSSPSFKITGSASQTAGATQNLTITRINPNGTTITSFTGDQSITFSGASSSGGNNPTIIDKNGNTIAFGSPALLTFTNGVATVSAGRNGVLSLYKAENAVIVASDGTYNSEGDDALAVTVSAAAFQLFFTTQPIGALAGNTFATQPVITVSDAYGNLNLGTSRTITAAIGTNPSSGTISGNTDLSLNTNTGIATFTNLSIDKAGASYTLVASSPGLSNATSSAFDISNPIPSVTDIPSPFLCSLSNNFSITVNGTNFNTQSVVYANGVARATTYVSGTQLQATLLASDIANFATPNIGVTNPSPGGGSTVPAPLALNYTYVKINPSTVQPTCAALGSITLSITGGTAPYTFDWTDISGSNNVQNRVGLDAGTYAVTVTDANGCGSTSANQVIVASSGCTGVTVCKTETASVFSTNPDPDNTSYTWTVPTGAIIVSGQGTSSITVNFTGTNVGIYQVSVTAINTCGTSTTTTQAVYVKAPAISAYADPVCSGSNLQLYVYGGLTNSWTGPNSFISSSSTPVIYNATAAAQNGTYTVTTTDAGGCSAITVVTVAVNTTPTITSAIISSTCGNSNGSITLTPTGGSGFTYSWDSGESTSSLSSLGSGDYIVTVNNSFGCSVTKKIVIPDSDGPSVTINTITNVDCFGSTNGGITLDNPTGGTVADAYGFLWSSGQTTQNISGVAAGQYDIIVSDDNGCQAGAVATITQPLGSILVNATSLTNVSCFGGSTGAINISVIGGTTPYSYTWSKTGGGFSANTQNISGLSAGIYSVTVTDNAGCSSTLSATITSPDAALSGTATAKAVNCFGASTGQITTSITGGTSEVKTRRNSRSKM